MVSKSLIYKTITSILLKHNNELDEKCSATGQIRKLGESVIVTSDNEYHGKTFSYDGGNIEIAFDEDETLVSVTYGDEEYNYFGKQDSLTEFDYQTNTLQNQNTIDKSIISPRTYNSDYELLKDYANSFATWRGQELNTALRQDNPIPDYAPILKVYHDWFTNLEQTLRVDHTDYATIRFTSKLHDNDALNRKIMSDKAHLSTSVGADSENLYNTFGTGDFDSSWKHINLISEGDGTTGLFLGNALSDEPRKRDWERELNFAPKQKFERVLIDEKNKIIIQIPKNK